MGIFYVCDFRVVSSGSFLSETCEFGTIGFVFFSFLGGPKKAYGILSLCCFVGGVFFLMFCVVFYGFFLYYYYHQILPIWLSKKGQKQKAKLNHLTKQKNKKVAIPCSCKGLFCGACHPHPTFQTLSLQH